MGTKFKFGQRVMCRDTGKRGHVVSVFPYGIYMWRDGQRVWVRNPGPIRFSKFDKPKMINPELLELSNRIRAAKATG